MSAVYEERLSRLQLLTLKNADEERRPKCSGSTMTKVEWNKRDIRRYGKKFKRTTCRRSIKKYYRFLQRRNIWMGLRSIHATYIHLSKGNLSYNKDRIDSLCVTHMHIRVLYQNKKGMLV